MRISTRKNRPLIYSIFVVLIFSSLLALTSPVSAEESLHKWGPWVVDQNPTCISQGHKYRICTKFPDSPHREEALIPKSKQHTYKRNVIPATCEHSGKITYICIYCGHSKTEKILPALGHKWQDWTIKQDATAEREGIEERICAHDPSHVERKTIPKLPPPITNQTTVKQDTPPPTLWETLTEPHIIGPADIAMNSAGASTFLLISAMVISDIKLILWARKRKKLFLERQRKMCKGGWGIWR